MAELTDIATAFELLPERLDLASTVLMFAGVGGLAGSGVGTVRGLDSVGRALLAERWTLLAAGLGSGVIRTCQPLAGLIMRTVRGHVRWLPAAVALGVVVICTVLMQVLELGVWSVYATMVATVGIGISVEVIQDMRRGEPFRRATGSDRTPRIR